MLLPAFARFRAQVWLETGYLERILTQLCSVKIYCRTRFGIRFQNIGKCTIAPVMLRVSLQAKLNHPAKKRCHGEPTIVTAIMPIIAVQACHTIIIQNPGNRSTRRPDPTLSKQLKNSYQPQVDGRIVLVTGSSYRSRGHCTYARR